MFATPKQRPRDQHRNKLPAAFAIGLLISCGLDLFQQFRSVRSQIRLRAATLFVPLQVPVLAAPDRLRDKRAACRHVELGFSGA